MWKYKNRKSVLHSEIVFFKKIKKKEMLLVLKKDQSCMSRKQGIGKSKWYGLVNK